MQERMGSIQLLPPRFRARPYPMMFLAMRRSNGGITAIRTTAVPNAELALVLTRGDE
jgi:hypothetical protein